MKFYLKNYKAIHHAATLAIFVLILAIAGFKESFTSIPFIVLILVLNYFISKFCLKISGVDEKVGKMLEEIEEK